MFLLSGLFLTSGKKGTLDQEQNTLQMNEKSIFGLAISPTKTQIKKLSQVDAAAVDSRGTLSLLFKASQSISLRILNRSSMDTNPA